MTRKWMEVLPPPFGVEKPIVAVLVPMDWEVIDVSTRDDKYKALVAATADRSKFLGLQIVDTSLPHHLDHRDKFREYKIKMADPAYIGPLSGLPNRLLLDEELTCLIFCRDEMWRRPIDLKRIWKQKPVEQKC